MNDVWVVDTAPLILLAKAGYLHLLPLLASEVLLPSPVVREVRKGRPNDASRVAVEAGFGTRVPISYIPAAVRALPGLDPGEKAVLALAWKRGDCTVVLDDAKGRSAADALGLPKIGTLGVVITALRQGHIPTAAPVLRALLAAGLYLDEKIIRTVLAGIGETWP